VLSTGAIFSFNKLFYNAQGRKAVVAKLVTNTLAVKRIILLFLALPIIFYTGGCGRNNEPGVQLPVEEVQIKGVLFELELALTPEERAEGLMGREKIAKNGGMLFVYPAEPPYPNDLGFWMKNCLVPIDLLFLDPTGRVVAIHEMEPPMPGTPDHELTSYRSGAPAQFAIELKGGRSAELGVTIGDVIELRFAELLEMAR
jgi:uncharacterized protein